MKLAEQLYQSAPLLPQRLSLGLQEDLIALHAAGDTVLAIACFSAAFWLVRARRGADTGLQRPARRWVIATAALLGCSALVGIWTIWAPLYYVSGAFKAAAALCGLRGAMLLWGSLRQVPTTVAANDSAPLPAPIVLRSERRGTPPPRENRLFENLRKLHVASMPVRLTPVLIQGRMVMQPVK